MNPRHRKLIAVTFSILSPMIGLMIGIAYGSPVVGALLGFTVLAISGLLVHYTWDQWLLVSLVALLWMLCALQPLPISLLYMLGSAFVGLGFAAISLRPLYGGNIWAAIQAAISLILGEPLSLQVVTPPESIRQAGTPDRFGPRRVIVKPNTAVVMEVGSRQTRILGPTVVVTEPYEYVQMIYSLQPHHRTLWYPHVLTQDLIASEVRVGITFGLGVEWDAREGLRPLLAAERNNIQLFHICAANWEDELTTVLEAVVRSVIGTQRFEQATDAALRSELEQEITTRLQEAATQWGIALHRTQLIAVQPDAQVHQAREQRFLSQTNAETIALYERARAQAWGEALAALGEAYADARDNGLPDTIIVREMLRRLMEQATSHVATQNMFPRVLRQAFDELDGARPNAPNGNGPAGASTPGP